MGDISPAIRLVGIGFYVALCIVIGVLGGRELDKALDTGSVFTVIGLMVGLALALYGAVRQLMEVLNAINNRRTGRQG
jgi:hypothetical protein